MSDSDATALEVRGLSMRFGGFQALSEVSFAVPRRGVHAFIGPNGAGKTTLFNCITGIRMPSAGQVLLGGRDVTRLPAHRRAQAGLGRSFQITNVFAGLSVRENVRLSAQAHMGGTASWSMLGARDRLAQANDRTDDALSELGLGARAETPAGQLPHGLQRRLEIAMAVVADPVVLLLDEPTSGMGIDDLSEMTELIGTLGQRRCVALIEHNIALIMSISETITVLQLGKLLLQGAPKDVAADPRVKAAYLGSQG